MDINKKSELWDYYSDFVKVHGALSINNLLRQRNNARAERDALQARLNEAVGRIKDILMQDDGQAYREAEKFLGKLEGQSDGL